MRESIIRLKLDQDVLVGRNIRKAFCGIFPDRDIYSQHRVEDGKTIVRYPLIQYRKSDIDKNFIVVYGINEGADELLKIYPKIPDEIEVALDYNQETRKTYKVLNKTIKVYDLPDKAIGKLTLYKTVTPIILIDKKARLEAYKKASTPKEKAELIKKWLVNNLVKTAHSLGLSLKEQVEIPYLSLAETAIKKKGIDMIGLKGEFVTNMRIGNLGIGHYASHGFGVVAKES